ncbi:uncharacterized protein LOC115952375 isoform X1 [Quercus lobata]|uniref:uncharacterized protein LOC115952375 isoform X1 n=1 Tax=Quercus lobata TaxID=97700 RepID=UPI001245A8E3|nr:uncharacterized protein LOC115952375 isoform X1 [Quercus lobata]
MKYESINLLNWIRECHGSYHYPRESTISRTNLYLKLQSLFGCTCVCISLRERVMGCGKSKNTGQVLHQNNVIRKKSKDEKNGAFEKEVPPVDKEESVTKEHDAEEPMSDKEKPIAMEKSDSDDELFFSADEEPESEPEDVDPTL